jgi:hypothetical protein
VTQAGAHTGGMSPSSVAGIITAVATVLTACGGVAATLVVLIPILRGTRANAAQIAEVHVMVNQRLTDAQRYQERLMEELVSRGIAIPRDTSLRAPEGGPAL